MSIFQAKKEAEELEKRKFKEEQKRIKDEKDIEKKKILDQIKRDKEERYGKKQDSSTDQPQIKKEYTPLENAEYYLKSIKTLFPVSRDGDKSKNCFSTLKVILTNIVKNQTEEKYRKVKTTNPNFNERVGQISFAIKTLAVLGFEEEGEFLIAKTPDFDMFNMIIALIEDHLDQLS
jgi:hypothetical protein